MKVAPRSPGSPARRVGNVNVCCSYTREAAPSARGATPPDQPEGTMRRDLERPQNIAPSNARRDREFHGLQLREREWEAFALAEGLDSTDLEEAEDELEHDRELAERFEEWLDSL